MNDGVNKHLQTGKTGRRRIVLILILAASLLLTGAAAKDFHPDTASPDTARTALAGDKVDLTVVTDTVGGAVSVSNEIATMPQAGPTPIETLVKLKNAGVPVFTIGGAEVPLVAFSGMAAWALLNLVFGVLGVVIVMAFMLFRTRKHGGRKHGRRKHDSARVDIFVNEAREEEQDGALKKIRFVARALAIAAGAFGAVFFIITENISSLMVMFDEWTRVNIIVFALILISIWVASHKEPSDDMDV